MEDQRSPILPRVPVRFVDSATGIRNPACGRQAAVLLALLCAGLVASRPAAQAQLGGGGEFRLSRSADFASDDREFTTLDTLHMRLECPASKDSLTETEIAAVTGWWRLEGPTQSFSGELAPQAGQLLAELPLAAVAEAAPVWIWSASVEWKGELLSTSIAALQITPILWPPFVEKLRAMNGGRGPVAWRAMDWNEVNQYGRTDGSAPFVFDLAGRITPASPSQGTKRGVCPEFQVALCNAVGADLHFNVPHPANGISDEDYEAFLRDAFTRIRDGSPAVAGVNGGQPFAPLAPNLHLAVEFSNEAWNPGFPVNAWLKTRAQQAGRTLREQAALEIRRVFAVAEEVFSGPDAARLRRYVGGWLGDPDFLREVLAGLGPEVQVDAAGPACYFAPRPEDIAAWMVDATPGSCPNCPTSEEVVESARLRIAVLDQKLLEHLEIVATHLNPDGSAPRFELYESGASFAAGYQPWGAAASQAQRLPAMYDLYVNDFVPALIARGVDTVLWYSFMTSEAQGSSGPFGHWERMDQTITLPVPEVYVDEGAPKAAAVYRLPPRRVP